MRLQAFLRATAAPGREFVAARPFTAYFNPTNTLKYLNYAIPADGAEPDGTRSSGCEGPSTNATGFRGWNGSRRRHRGSGPRSSARAWQEELARR